MTDCLRPYLFHPRLILLAVTGIRENPTAAWQKRQSDIKQRTVPAGGYDSLPSGFNSLVGCGGLASQ
jgi:hypothetical protein